MQRGSWSVENLKILTDDNKSIKRILSQRIDLMTSSISEGVLKHCSSASAVPSAFEDGKG